MEDRKDYMRDYYINNKDKWKIYYMNYLNKKKGIVLNKIKLFNKNKKLSFEKIDKNIIIIFD